VNKTFLQQLLNWPKPYLTGADLMIALGKSPDARKGVIKRAVQEGYLIRIRRDFYLIKVSQNTPPVDSFELAPILFGPSYVSLESALQFHGWIPEAVPVITSVTVKKSKEFETSMGTFCYHHIPVSAFHMGVNQIHQNGSILFIANPWKAVADLVHIQDKHWDTLEAFSADMRVEMDKIYESDRKILEYLSKNYPNKKVRQTLKKLVKNGN
jgi:hypothetical protein